jgi:methyl-accepting chemotaxis protein
MKQRLSTGGKGWLIAGEALAFAPIFITWTAIWLASSASQDASDYGTFLEGWRDGFGNKDAIWRLSHVAAADAFLILVVAVLLVVARIKTYDDGTTPTASALDGFVDLVSSAERASTAAAQSSVSLDNLTERVSESTKLLNEAANKIAGATDRLAAAVADMVGAMQPAEDLRNAAAQLNSQLAAAVASVGLTSTRAEELADRVDRAAADVAESMDVHAAQAKQVTLYVRQLTEVQRGAWDTAGAGARTTKELLEATLDLARQLKATIEFTQDGRRGSSR